MTDRRNMVWDDFWLQFKPEIMSNYYRNWYQNHLDERRQRSARDTMTVRVNILTHYGDGKLACVSCGFSDIRALCLDHINGGGNQERKEKDNNSMLHLYRRLRKEDYPEGYQTLCYNCNIVKAYTNGEHYKGKGRRY